MQIVLSTELKILATCIIAAVVLLISFGPSLWSKLKSFISSWSGGTLEQRVAALESAVFAGKSSGPVPAKAKRARASRAKGGAK